MKDVHIPESIGFIWRIPVAVILGVTALILFAIDDFWRLVQRVLRRNHASSNKGRQTKK